MSTSDRLIDAIVGLIRGTQEGRIIWSLEKVSPTIVYETVHKGRRLRIYEGLGHSPTLEIIDENGTPLWTFPTVSGLDDLLSSVRYEAADVRGFVDDIIRDYELERESGVH